MDQHRFDALARSLTAIPRRMALGGALAAGAAALAPLGPGAEAKKRKRKKKPDCPCPVGQEKCGNVCCSPDRECSETGFGCTCKTPCGSVCCPDGMGCINGQISSCGCSDDTTCGILVMGCDCQKAVGGFDLCFVSAGIDCNESKSCGSNFDCAVGEACNLIACEVPSCVPLCP